MVETSSRLSSNKQPVSKRKGKKGRFCSYYFDSSFKGFSKRYLDSRSEIVVDGVNSKYIGKHILRNGVRDQKFFKSPSPARDFYRCNEDFFNSYEIDVERSLNVCGNWHTNKCMLQEIATADVGEVNESYDKFREEIDPIIKQLIKKIPFTTLPTAVREDMELCSFSKNTMPGFRYEEYLEKRTKESAAPIALEVAKIRWDYIEGCSRKKVEVDRNSLIPGTYTIGARNKRDYTFEEGEEVKSRAIHMPEFHTEIISSCWIDPITEHIVDCKRGALFIGNTYLDYERYWKILKGRKNIIEGDWKGFDSSLYLYIINASVSLLRCFYPLKSERVDKHFEAIFDTVSIKDYYCPGGNLYRMKHGLPSGVKATNLLGSLINLIALGYCVGEKNIRYIDFAVGGDDFIIAPDDTIELSLDEITLRSEDLGMKFKFLEEKDPTSSKLDSLPSFYKYVIKDGIPMIPTTALYERVFMPWSKQFKNIFDVEEHLAALLPSFSYPNSAFLPVYYYYAKILSLCRRERVSIIEIFRKHEYINRQVFERKIQPYKIKEDDGGSFYITEARISNFELVSCYRDVFVPNKKKVLKVI